MKNLHLDNHEERIKPLEYLCTKNASSASLIHKSKSKGIPRLKWYLLMISLILNVYLIIKVIL